MSTVTPDLKVSYGELCDFYNKYHIVAATMDRVKTDTEVLEAEIHRLKVINERQENRLIAFKQKLDNAKTIIHQAFANNDFDKEVVSHIAAALDIDMTREYDVQVTVTFDGFIIAPLGLDVEELESFLNPELLIDYRDGIEGSFETEDVSIDIRPMD